MENSKGMIFRWINWPLWVLLNASGILIGYTLGLLSAPVVGWFGLPVTDQLITWVMIPAIGISLSIFQWLLIRMYLRPAGWWIAATTLGWIFGVVIAFILSTAVGRWSESPRLEFISLFSIIWLIMGIAQWFGLRRQVAGAGSWIAGSLTGGLLLGLILENPITNILGTLLVGAVPALITGLLLVWLLVKEQSSPASESTINEA